MNMENGNTKKRITLPYINCREKLTWSDAMTGDMIPLDNDQPVYLLVPEEYSAKYGAHIKENHYRGYGIFGDYDVFELIMGWNYDFIPTVVRLMEKNEWFCLPVTSEIEDLKKLKNGVPVALHNTYHVLGRLLALYDEDNERLKYPIKITLNPNATYEEGAPSFREDLATDSYTDKHFVQDEELPLAF